MNIVVRRYTPALSDDWANVLSRAKNSVFLFERRFIEYHGDRFIEMSAIAYVDDKPVALIPGAFDPASREVISHPGLTFGGVVLQREIRGTVAIRVIEAILDAYREWGATTCIIKVLPQFFSSYPSSELDYVLWRRGFVISRRDLSSILPLKNCINFNTSKRQAVAKAVKSGISISPANPYEFHKLLSDVLIQQHGVSPVHSAAEMGLLASLFPKNIAIVGAWFGDDLLAGSMVFRYGHVWHTQYLACSERGRECGALDLVINTIKDQAATADASYLSFGASTELAGTVVNEGLLWQKESFGARSISHDFMSGQL